MPYHRNLNLIRLKQIIKKIFFLVVLYMSKILKSEPFTKHLTSFCHGDPGVCVFFIFFLNRFIFIKTYTTCIHFPTIFLGREFYGKAMPVLYRGKPKETKFKFLTHPKCIY